MVLPLLDPRLRGRAPRRSTSPRRREAGASGPSGPPSGTRCARGLGRIDEPSAAAPDRWPEDRRNASRSGQRQDRSGDRARSIVPAGMRPPSASSAHSVRRRASAGIRVASASRSRPSARVVEEVDGDLGVDPLSGQQIERPGLIAEPLGVDDPLSLSGLPSSRAKYWTARLSLRGNCRPMTSTVSRLHSSGVSSGFPCHRPGGAARRARRGPRRRHWP